ncbi:GNAT family N-acetyltransferase [Roseicyclus sp.]|uniref:GNAT family N-acetyltransferase n=1 Tax=Roseicyclus sp. TaxID=1914329 RepID=UPI003FA05198
MVSKVETNPADFADFDSLHRLLSEAFAYMDGVIDPPSSMTRLTLEDLTDKVGAEDLLLIRDASGPVACLFGTPKGDVYYIGKLAVAGAMRGKGLARRLVEAAAARATSLGLRALELQSRVELTGNHAAFRAMGFAETGRSAHPGYDRPTSITFRCPI